MTGGDGDQGDHRGGQPGDADVAVRQEPGQDREDDQGQEGEDERQRFHTRNAKNSWPARHQPDGGSTGSTSRGARDLGPGPQPGFLQDVRDVGLHRTRWDEQPGADLPVGQPVADHRGDPVLGRGQGRPAEVSVPVRLPGAPPDAQRAGPGQGAVPVRDGAEPLVAGQGRVQGRGGAIPVPGRGRRAGQFLPAERLGRQTAGPGELRGRVPDRVGNGSTQGEAARPGPAARPGSPRAGGRWRRAARRWRRSARSPPGPLPCPPGSSGSGSGSAASAPPPRDR